MRDMEASSAPATQLIRSASLVGYAELARSLGLDPVRMAIEAGAPAEALADPDLMIASDAVGRLLERSARAGGAEDFGLRLAATRRLSNLGPVGAIAREQPTMRKALEVLGQFLWLHNEALSLALELDGDIAVARLVIQAGGRRVSRQAVELAVGVLTETLRGLLGEAWRPDQVLLRHGPPADLAAHRRVFGAAPQFRAELDGLVLARRDLDRQLAGAAPAAQPARRLAEEAAGARRRRARDAVGELIVLLLPTGVCSADEVARRLGVDRRTLHRRLAREGCGYHALLDEKRRELALSMMAAGRALGEISDLAGFPDQSGFSHWFRRRFGEAPRDYLSRLRRGDSAGTRPAGYDLT